MAIHKTRMLIIGSGPAGLSAAIYGARAGMEPIVVQGLQPGGQLTITTDVENYPGFRDVIQGPWLMQEMQAQAEHVGTRMLWDTITSIDLSASPFRAIGDGGDVVGRARHHDHRWRVPPRDVEGRHLRGVPLVARAEHRPGHPVCERADVHACLPLDPATSARVSRRR